MKIASALFVILGVSLSGCGGDTTEPTIGASGSLSFSYTGAGAAASTSFSATGAVPANVLLNNGSSPWAAATVDASSNVTDIWGVIPRTGNSWDITSIQVNRTSTGTGTIDLNCSTQSCTDIEVWFGANQNETNFTYFCTLTTGTVTISAISSTNIQGTFSGSGSCHASTGGDTPFTVTNGSFNVGITTQL